MSTLLYSLGRWSYRHPWRVLLTWLLLLALAGGGVALFAKGTSNTFSIPGTESQAGLEQLSHTFPQVSGTSAQIIVVAADGTSITDDEYVEPIDDAINQLEDIDGVLAVTSPYSDTVTGSISDDENAALIRMQFEGQSTDVSDASISALENVSDELGAALPSDSIVSLGGDLFSSSVPGLSITELVGLIIALLVLIATFRSFVIAGLPLATALIGVGLSMALIYGATAFATVSSTTPLLALMLGLAVGIDYALFIIARHQDQVRTGVDPEESTARANGTAGSAVVFAGITVLIALIGLSFANIPFLTTMGIAAAVAVAIAVALAVTLTPALLGFTKARVVGWRRRVPTVAKVSNEAEKPRQGFATRWVSIVTKHPVVTSLIVVVTLGVVAIPSASLGLALPNAGQLPKDNSARQTYDLVDEYFGPGANGPLIMTGTIVTSTDPVTLMDDIADEVAKIPGVKEIALATPNESADTGIVQIIPETAPDDPATADLVRELRDRHDYFLDEYGIDLKVTGYTAVAIDISDRLSSALLPFGIFVVGLSLILLTIVFRSIWVPIVAALGYLLSVVAAFGVVAAVFEWGWFADALHVARVGPIISFMPIVLMGVLFGLAMDYQVFLVSRMREDFIHTRKKAGHRSQREIAIAAVRSGFTASARVVTAAGVIMFAVFAAFIPEGDSNLKPIALGLASGIVIDAFLIRMTLVPAVMALLGDKAWWIPKWLDRILPHFDIEGEAVERELSLAEWPEPNCTAAVVAEDLALHDNQGAQYSNVTVRIEPGETLVISGVDALGPRALGLTFAGRLDPSEGRLRVTGHLLPERSAWARAYVGVALLDGAADPERELRTALGGGTTLIMIDGLDRVPASERYVVTELIRAAAGSRTLTVVATTTEAVDTRALLVDSGLPQPTNLTLTESGGSIATAIASEVSA
ncbi:RND superfamily putative drug exporter [Microbacterium halimionae]|uniref:RND superfamily putative drug exporter n=1 Tax=Microbacterium halimionae TaxID=1526413 RepID=A0A7W3JM17_9MICO|nr:MMPL family transporter [Microbacterium halimionae]MBA8815332.1 RND superfamily putative drug exporter [Microbacterium halimionae]NII93877.1 RND superfamily putative drug exporter [Microbacterium halimionae]